MQAVRKTDKESNKAGHVDRGLKPSCPRIFSGGTIQWVIKMLSIIIDMMKCVSANIQFAVR